MDICRICLSKNTNINVFDLCSDDGETYSDLMLFCLELKIPENTTVKTICKACSESLENFYRFKVLALKNEMLLEEMELHIRSNNNDINVKIENELKIDVKIECNDDEHSGDDEFHRDDEQQVQYLEDYEIEYLDNDIEAQKILSSTFCIDATNGRESPVMVDATTKVSGCKKQKQRKNMSDYYDDDPPYEPPSCVSQKLLSNKKTKPKTVSAIAMLPSELPVKFKCPKCNTYVENIRDHMGTAHDYENSDSFICYYCSKTFRTEIGFDRHIESQHGVNQFADAKLTCNICYRDFKHLESHMATSHGIGDNLVECMKCSHKFLSADILAKHYATVHQNTKKYKKKPKKSENRKSKYNTKEYFVCQFCSKEFKYLTRLERHELSHTGIKQFRCEQCGNCFAYSYALTKHQMRHTGIKTFICDICNKSFYTKGAVKAHMTKHTSAQPFSCDYCDMKFKRKFNKVDHQKRAHPKELNTPFIKI